MDEAKRAATLEAVREGLALTARRTLTPEQQDELVGATLENFTAYANPDIIEYRKAVSTDHACVEWEGEGAVFRDAHGREFIDCISCYGVLDLGHRHPRVVQAVTDQLQRQPMNTIELLDPLRGYLGKALAAATPGGLQHSFLCNSGTEAVEAALKIAKLYAYSRKKDHSKAVISTTRGFHGKSLGSLSVTGKAEFREPFVPLVPGARFVPYGDADALARELRVCDMIGLDVAAFIAEPVQGEAGAIVPPDEYFPKVRELCDEWGVLLVADEVQTGMGRTGKLWAIEHWGVAPDVMAMAKSLGGGVMPAGAAIATEEVFAPMMEDCTLHTTTFGGNPLACAAALAALEVTIEEDLPTQAAEKGTYLKTACAEIAADFPQIVSEVRGLGLLIGFQFPTCEIGFAVASGLFERGILVSGSLTNAETFRLIPPLVISYGQLDTIIAAWGETLEETQELLRQGTIDVQ